MKRLVVVLAIVFVVLAVLSLRSKLLDPDNRRAPREAGTAQIKAEVEQAITTRWADFKVALENEDYDRWASFWTPDVWVLEPGMDLSGSDLFDTVRDIFASGVQVLAWDVRPAETFVHGDVAYQIGQMDETLQIPGAEPAKGEGNFFARWEKEDGVWKIDRLVVGPREAPAEG